VLSAGRAAVYRYHLTAGPTAANPPQGSGVWWPNDGMNGQTDAQTLNSIIDPAAHTMQTLSIIITGNNSYTSSQLQRAFNVHYFCAFLYNVHYFLDRCLFLFCYVLYRHQMGLKRKS